MHLRSSGGIPSGPAARPLRSLRIAEMVSSRDGASTGVSVSLVVVSASVSKSSLRVPGGWLSAAVKCSRQRCKVSFGEVHGDPSALLTNGMACAGLLPASTLMALNAGPRWLDLIPSSTPSTVRVMKASWSSLALILKALCSRFLSVWSPRFLAAAFWSVMVEAAIV